MRFFYSIVIFTFLWMNGAYSQLVRVTGRVTDFNNLPLFQVAIQEQGKFQATLTDSEGNYEVNVHKGAMLVFSKAGYTSIEMQTEDEEVLNISMNEDMLLNRIVADVGYYSLHRNKFSDAVGYLDENNFNQGNIYDPAMLLQGRIPGLNISNRGGDPNVESTIRIRGLSSFDSKAQPLIVIDGVPMASFINLDPQDVASVTILKDGASASIYGIRGSGGVILITTKKATMKSGLSVSLSAQGSVASLSKEQPVLTSSQHIQVGGSDLGSSTDWQREITRMGFSQEYHLAVSGANKNTSFRVSTHLRSVNGTLLNSGFDQANTRLNVMHQTPNKKLRFSVNAAFTNRNVDYAFPEAFKFAVRFIPTAPIRFANGVFYQAILFENYNPVALLEQNINEGRRRVNNFSARIDWDVLRNLTASIQVAHQQSSNYKGQFYSRESLYKGLNNNGLAEKFMDESTFIYAESYLTYKVELEKLMVNFIGGYAYQEDQANTYGASIRNFDNDASGIKTLSYSYEDLANQPGLMSIYNSNTPDNRTIAGFFRTHWRIGSALNLFSSLRYEGSSKLGKNSKSGMFGSLGMNMNLLPQFKQTNLKTFNLRLSYGTTGSIPTAAGLAQDRYQYSELTGNTVKIHSGNPNLRWEQKREINIGVDLGWSNLSFSVDGYNRRISDLILLGYNQMTEAQYVNSADLSGRGLEVTLGSKVGEKNGVQWYPMLMLNAHRVVVKKYPVKQEIRSSAEFCGCGTLLIRTAVGEKVGQMWSPVYDGINASGYPIMKDTNGDGMLVVNSGEALNSNTDFTDVGYALPPWELGWNNRILYRRFQMSLFFRGAFGHSLVNSARMSHEPEDLGAINSYNRIRTNKAVSGLSSSVYSSLYVERADFLMLDNLSVEYTIPLKTGRNHSSMKAYVAAQRLFTITKYSGVDPEPVLFDTYATTSIISKDVLAPGIDRMGSYFPARTFTIGLSFKL
jgi:TonB-linked SusC/RagA family outer membrane protein